MTNAATTAATEVMGYQVERQPNAHQPGAFAYMLTGKRGAVYGLLRYRENSRLMYVVQARTGAIVGLKGNYTWSDRDGTPRPWNGS